MTAEQILGLIAVGIAFVFITACFGGAIVIAWRAGPSDPRGPFGDLS